MSRPFDRMDPDIGTTIQCNDIFLVDVATLAEEAENQIDLFLVETLLVENLRTNTDDAGRHLLHIISINDHRAVTGWRDDKG